MANACKCENGWEFVWLKNGSIFACRAEKSPIVAINTKDDNNKFCVDDAAHIVARGAQKSRVVCSDNENDNQNNGADSST